MDVTTIAIIALLMFAVALLYSTVGHAGASGYLAAMALFNTPPALMRPTALTLNIIVATVGTMPYRWVIAAGSLPQGTFHPDNPSDAELARRKKLAAEGSGI